MRLTLPLGQIENKTIETLKKLIFKGNSEAAPYVQAAKENSVILGQKFSRFNNWYKRITGVYKVHLSEEKVAAESIITNTGEKRDVGRQQSEKAAPHIQAAKENRVKIFSQFNNWYNRVTGLDKVHLAREKVTALQSQLLQIQEKRRDVGVQLSEVIERSMKLQDEIHKVKKQDDLKKFLDLMKEETEVLKLKKSITKVFQDYDQAERKLFTVFTDSIRDSYEKQTAQMEYLKYFGLILSITASFLAFVYSKRRNEQPKTIVDELLQTINNSNHTVSVSEISYTEFLIVVVVMWLLAKALSK